MNYKNDLLKLITAIIVVFSELAYGSSKSSCAQLLAKLTKTLSEKNLTSVKNPYSLKFKGEMGEFVVESSSYLFNSKGGLRKKFEVFTESLLSKTPDEFEDLLQRMTKAHAENEMSFKMKNKSTGKYDKIFNVPVRGIAPIDYNFYKNLVKSTEPMMQFLRRILQEVYSTKNGVSKKFLDEVDPHFHNDLIDAVNIVKNNIYYDNDLINPVFKDYPFLSIGGFDATIGNLEKFDPIFFEFNTGTPSGLSNNIQLLNILKKEDPKLFSLVKDRLPKDDTFKILKNAIDSNAYEWTKKTGISVVVGPGVNNGAHPDVASIALFSGMPLVKLKDMYVDGAGKLRLNIGKFSKDPVVTGIYSRMEESFIMQSDVDKIGLIDPLLFSNDKLGEKLGVELKKGVKYQFIYNKNKEIVGVKKDKFGKPLFESLALDEQLGRDPMNPSRVRKSLFSLIKSKNVYLSNFGGRAVDDKRIFETFSRILQPKYDFPVSRPPKTLQKFEYNIFFEANDRSHFVVKAPDGSGGAGVYIMANLNESKQKEVVELVRNDPARYSIQYFANMTALTSPQKMKNGRFTLGSVANDARLFVVMDGKGNVNAGPNSVLIRTAGVGSASTNTSQGGGYALSLPLLKTKAPRSINNQIIKSPLIENVGVSRLSQMRDYIVRLEYLRSTLVGSPSHNIITKDYLESLIALQVDLIDLVGNEHSTLITNIRKYVADDISGIDLAREIDQVLHDLTNGKFPLKGVAEYSDELRSSVDKAKYLGRNWQLMHDNEFLNREFRWSYFDVSNDIKSTVGKSKPSKKIELAELVSSNNEFINGVIKELKEFGGGIRQIKEFDNGKEISRPSTAYFEVRDGVPLIAVDFRQPDALGGLAHEHDHFKVWRKLYTLFLDSFPKEVALKKAEEQSLLPSSRVYAERSALLVEMEVEKSGSSIFNKRMARRAEGTTHKGYPYRMKYPEIEGVRDILFRAKWNKNDPYANIAQAENLLKESIEFTLEYRKNALLKLKSEIDKIDIKNLNTLEQKQKSNDLVERYNYFKYTSVYTLLLHDAAEIRKNETLSVFNDLFWKTYRKCISRDYFSSDADKVILSVKNQKKQKSDDLLNTKIFSKLQQQQQQQ